VRILVDEVALGEVSLRVLQFSPVSIILPVPHTRLRLNTTLAEGQRQRVVTTKQSTAVSNIVEPEYKTIFSFDFLCLKMLRKQYVLKCNMFAT
jgi:hypothetical protein